MCSESSFLKSAILDSVEIQIAAIDPDGKILYVNQAWVNFGKANGLPENHPWIGNNYLGTCQSASSAGDTDGAAVYAGIRAVLAGEKQGFEYEYPCHSPDEKRWFMMRVAPLRGADRAFVVSHHVITARKLAEERVERANRDLSLLATTDKLTQLPNRAKLDEVLEAEYSRSGRYGIPLSIAMVDIDHFKDINDSHGHQAGDAVLQEIAALMQANIRKSDAVGRWGGEEFMIIMPGIAADAALLVAEKLRAIIATSEFPIVGHLTCSLGIAQHCAGQDTTDLIRNADRALYRAKHLGRNQVALLPATVVNNS